MARLHALDRIYKPGDPTLMNPAHPWSWHICEHRHLRHGGRRLHPNVSRVQEPSKRKGVRRGAWRAPGSTALGKGAAARKPHVSRKAPALQKPACLKGRTSATGTTLGTAVLGTTTAAGTDMGTACGTAATSSGVVTSSFFCVRTLGPAAGVSCARVRSQPLAEVATRRAPATRQAQSCAQHVLDLSCLLAWMKLTVKALDNSKRVFSFIVCISQKVSRGRAMLLVKACKRRQQRNGGMVAHPWEARPLPGYIASPHCRQPKHLP